MKKFSRKLFLFIALFISLQAFAQTDPDNYPYYDDVIIDETTGEVIGPDYDDDSQPAWITTVDSREWTIPEGGHVAVNPETGQFQFGVDAWAGAGGDGNSGSLSGTVDSPDFSTDSELTMRLNVTPTNNAPEKNSPIIDFTFHYKDINGAEKTVDTKVQLIIPRERYVIISGTPTVIYEGNNQWTIKVPLPTDYGSDGKTTIHITASGNLILGAGTGGDDNPNTIVIWGDNLVLRDDWDNAERLRQNAGKKLKKVTIVRSYDKGWYTLSLPFDLTMKQFQRRFMDGFSKETALANGYTWKENTSAEIWEHTSFNSDTKVMLFEKKYSAGQDAAVLSAGVPYLIYIPTSITNTLYDFTRPGLDPDSQDFTNSDKVMVFTNITLASEAILTGSASTVEKETGYQFVSNLSKTNLSDVIAANQIYYLSTDAAGENPVLKKPSSASTNIKGFRAYFVSPKAAEAKPYSLSFMNEVPNSIGAVETQFTTDEHVYNMQGQYVGKSLKDLPRGIYVVNHKKYVIK